MSDAILVCEGLRKSYGDLVAVDGISFSIAEGETYGLLGPNGAGKTTSIAMIVGILARDAGMVTVDGIPHSVNSMKSKALIGYVPQDLALYQDLSGRENLRFFARLYGLSGKRLRSKVDEVLEVVGLSDRAGDATGTYSGGMARRLNIAAGLLNKPRLLVLDEPTAGVDPHSRNAILDSVQRLAGEGTAVLYTTHYMEEAERLCDRVGIIDSGRLQAEGTRRELVDLVKESDQVLFTLDGDVLAAQRELAALPEVREAGAEEHRVHALVADARAQLPGLLAAVAAAGAAVRSVEVVEPNLEAVFLQLTGKALRD
ncbi:ABC transporter ATP-binding protein [Crossiella equi]|nr:ABC transporter ATP-binding protein [Crossiella equi]